MRKTYATVRCWCWKEHKNCSMGEGSHGRDKSITPPLFQYTGDISQLDPVWAGHGRAIKSAMCSKRAKPYRNFVVPWLLLWWLLQLLFLEAWGLGVWYHIISYDYIHIYIYTIIYIYTYDYIITYNYIYIFYIMYIYIYILWRWSIWRVVSCGV